jgi:predicted nucleic acid-binding protein
MTRVDTSVLIDPVQDDAEWASWSEAKPLEAQQAGALTINLVGYAELLAAFDSMADLDGFFKRAKIAVKDISRPAACLAGEAFLRYRKRKAVKTGGPADFFIGAQAQTEGWAILTRDAARYKTYFPAVTLICPSAAGQALLIW